MHKHSFPAHGGSVITSVLLSHGRIISASDNHTIHVHSLETAELIHSLQGHEGGVWSIAATQNTLVSGSSDQTVRIWDLKTGRCKHIFGGHTSTIRALAIVKPELVDVEGSDGVVTQQRWPKKPLIVTGSRDHTLRVWALPKPQEREYRYVAIPDIDPTQDANVNPYHLFHLQGHEQHVRTLAAKGRTLVSGSYDTTVRVWDLTSGECKWVLQGHTQKVYSVVLDYECKQACSGSMDATIRIWNLVNGQCRNTLIDHTSLVGLLGLSPSYLVSASADATIGIWDRQSGDMRHVLSHHTGAITCCQHDDFKLLSGSDGALKLWNIRDGTHTSDLLTGTSGVWQVAFKGRWCVAASNRNNRTMLDIWDFGEDEANANLMTVEALHWKYTDEVESAAEEEE